MQREGERLVERGGGERGREVGGERRWGEREKFRIPLTVSFVCSTYLVIFFELMNKTKNGCKNWELRKNIWDEKEDMHKI